MRILILLLFMNGVTMTQDWANLNKHKKQNSKLGPPKISGNRIVFIHNIFQRTTTSTGVLVAKQHLRC